ncbi:MAG: hypothetical protein M5U08_01480 [Burkholderiales bacterium]|nr:hypothetical protein [Burkholderiales bacterium]
MSVALIEQGRPRLGVVYNPAMDETFHAAAGEGAYLDGVRIASRPAPAGARRGGRLRRAEAHAAHRGRAPRARAAVVLVPQLRRRGARLVLARGGARFDVYLHASHMLWDYAAGALVLAEAGGAMSTFEDDDFFAGGPWSKSVLAGRDAGLFAQWRRYVRARLRSARARAAKARRAAPRRSKRA